MRCKTMDWMESSVVWIFTTAFLCFGEAQARDYCGKFDGKDYYCDEGQCCGEFDCCNYYKYYKMWWFWLVWGLISLLACCCAYHQRRNFASHWQIRNFVYSSTMPSTAEPTSSYQQLENDPKYKLPTYAEVEAMGSLGPPADGEDAPPPYMEPVANEELEDETSLTQSSGAFAESREDVRICLITQDSEAQPPETL